MLFHPVDVVGHKAQHFWQLWSPSPVDRGQVFELFRRIKVEAEVEQLPEITLQELDYATGRMKPKAGLGADRLTALDVQRLPVEGRR
eukprot:1271204-Pyramimonas_sp.AAC.1